MLIHERFELLFDGTVLLSDNTTLSVASVRII